MVASMLQVECTVRFISVICELCVVRDIVTELPATASTTTHSLTDSVPVGGEQVHRVPVPDNPAGGGAAVGDEPPPHRHQPQEALHQVHAVGVHQDDQQSGGERRGGPAARQVRPCNIWTTKYTIIRLVEINNCFSWTACVFTALINS